MNWFFIVLESSFSKFALYKKINLLRNLMNVHIQYNINGAIATFSGDIKENEIRDAFIDIIEKVNIKKTKYILLDLTDITSYVTPPNYVNLIKILTNFSASYNENIKAITVATHPNIMSMVKGIIKNKEKFKWEFFLFDNLLDAQKLIANN